MKIFQSIDVHPECCNDWIFSLCTVTVQSAETELDNLRTDSLATLIRPSRLAVAVRLTENEERRGSVSGRLVGSHWSRSVQTVLLLVGVFMLSDLTWT